MLQTSIHCFVCWAAICIKGVLLAGPLVAMTKSETEVAGVDNEEDPIFTEGIVEQNGKFACSICKKEFDQRCACRYHHEVHLGKTTCHYCSKVFSSRQTFLRHMITHTGAIKCDVCKKSFSNRYDMMRHIKNIHRTQRNKKLSTCF